MIMMKTKKLYDEGQAGQDHKGNLKLIVAIMRIMLLLIDCYEDKPQRTCRASSQPPCDRRDPSPLGLNQNLCKKSTFDQNFNGKKS